MPTSTSSRSPPPLLRVKDFAVAVKTADGVQYMCRHDRCDQNCANKLYTYDQMRTHGLRLATGYSRPGRVTNKYVCPMPGCQEHRFCRNSLRRHLRNRHDVHELDEISTLVEEGMRLTEEQDVGQRCSVEPPSSPCEARCVDSDEIGLYKTPGCVVEAEIGFSECGDGRPTPVGQLDRAAAVGLSVLAPPSPLLLSKHSSDGPLPMSLTPIADIGAFPQQSAGGWAHMEEEQMALEGILPSDLELPAQLVQEGYAVVDAAYPPLQF